MAKKYDYQGTTRVHHFKERKSSGWGWAFVIGFFVLAMVIGGIAKP